jgi:hypothetical protein
MEQQRIRPTDITTGTSVVHIATPSVGRIAPQSVDINDLAFAPEQSSEIVPYVMTEAEVAIQAMHESHDRLDDKVDGLLSVHREQTMYHATEHARITAEREARELQRTKLATNITEAQAKKDKDTVKERQSREIWEDSVAERNTLQLSREKLFQNLADTLLTGKTSDIHSETDIDAIESDVLRLATQLMVLASPEDEQEVSKIKQGLSKLLAAQQKATRDDLAHKTDEAELARSTESLEFAKKEMQDHIAENEMLARRYVKAQKNVEKGGKHARKEIALTPKERVAIYARKLGRLVGRTNNTPQIEPITSIGFAND